MVSGIFARDWYLNRTGKKVRKSLRVLGNLEIPANWIYFLWKDSEQKITDKTKNNKRS